MLELVKLVRVSRLCASAWLGRIATPLFTFGGTSQLCPGVAVPFHLPINNVQSLQFLHILTNSLVLCLFDARGHAVSVWLWFAVSGEK